MDNLTQFYDDLKKNSSERDVPHTHPTVSPGVPMTMVTPNQDFMNKCHHHCMNLKDNCRKHVLLDIYCKILPMDQDWKDGHMGVCKHDIDCMLKNKGMTATQYLTSAYESTKAPLLEYILRATDIIGREYLKEAEEIAKDDAEKGITTPDPKEPDVDEDENVNNQLIDIEQGDDEYNAFIDKLKKKTIDKIVADVSDLINNKKQENEMSFNPKPAAGDAVAEESAVSVSMDYLQKQLMKEHLEADTEEMMAYAIREATLHQLDVVFNLPAGKFNEFASMIRWGKGALINESAIQELTAKNVINE